MKSRLGKNAGVVATAHKLVLIIYSMMKGKLQYSPQITLDNQEKWKLKRIKYLGKQLYKPKMAVGK